MPFARAYTALVEHPRLAELWPEYLVLQHQIIRATVPLTEAALARSRELDDPLAAPLARYFEEHVDEELGHDETLLADLDLLGLDRTTVLGRMPSPAVAALVGGQYYWIHHYHPVAFLGFVALMEGYPPTPELIDELVERTGIRAAPSAPMSSTPSSTRGTATISTARSTRCRWTTRTRQALGISAIATAALAARSLEELVAER